MRGNPQPLGGAMLPWGPAGDPEVTCVTTRKNYCLDDTHGKPGYCYITIAAHWKGWSQLECCVACGLQVNNAALITADVLGVTQHIMLLDHEGHTPQLRSLAEHKQS